MQNFGIDTSEENKILAPLDKVLSNIKTSKKQFYLDCYKKYINPILLETKSVLEPLMYLDTNIFLEKASDIIKNFDKRGTFEGYYLILKTLIPDYDISFEVPENGFLIININNSEEGIKYLTDEMDNIIKTEADEEIIITRSGIPISVSLVEHILRIITPLGIKVELRGTR